MTKAKKIKTVVLLIIYAISLIFIVIGASPSGCEENGVRNVSLNSAYNISAESGYEKFNVKISSSGYYYVYIDGAELYQYKYGNNTYTPSVYDYNAVKNSYTYDYMYKLYLYSDETYQFTVDSNKGYTFKLYITR